VKSIAAIVAGIAGIVPVAAIGAAPALATEHDPAFAVVARARATYDAMLVAYQTAEPFDDAATDAAADLHDEEYYELLDTVPTTVEGLAVVISFMTYASTDESPYLRCEEDTFAFFQTLDEALRRLTGTAS
jgi:hypothetical protein